MALFCYSCRRRTATIHCFTENASFCLTCDYFLHSQANTTEHIRNPLCDDCSYSPAIFVCHIHRTVLCRPCYSLSYNCATYGHRLKILRHFPQQIQLHNNNDQHQHDEHVHVPQQQQNNNNNHHHHQQVPVPQEQHNNNNHNHHVGGQRREGMFTMTCNGNNNCERWMFEMRCESCFASNAVVYCELDDLLLCNNCDRRIHHSEEAGLPHMRSVLCVTCKRVSPNFLIGANQFSLTPTLPSAAPEASIGPNQQDSNRS